MLHDSAPDVATPRPTSVYRYYDSRDALIYVGITDRGSRRQAEHNHDKQWWPFVARQDVEHYDARADALARERDLIREFLPPFNVQHHPAPAETREQYLRWVASREVADDPTTLLRDVGRRLPLVECGVGLFRTHEEHAAIGSRLTLPEPVAVNGQKMAYGLVRHVVTAGPVALIALSGQRRPIAAAWACVRILPRKQGAWDVHLTAMNVTAVKV